MTADPTPTELELREQLYHAMDGNLRMSRRRELLTAYRDAILAGAAPAVPGAEPEPTPLRWGLNDVMWGDDDTVTVLLSGPDREPYWLELDPERAAVLRQNLAGPDGQTPDQEIHLLRLTLNGVEASRKELRAETASLRSKLWTLGAALDGMGTLLATSSRDWQPYRVDAWLWAVLCGWDCEASEHDDTCTHGALEETAAMHGWDAGTVAKARRYRAAVRDVTAAAETPAPKPTPCSDPDDGLREQYAAAIRAQAETGNVRYEALADAVLPVRDRRMQQLQATGTRVRDLADQWTQAGPPPLGTSVSRWWDARLAELLTALGRPDADTEEGR